MTLFLLCFGLAVMACGMFMFAMAGNWTMFLIILGFAVGILWLWAIEHRWPQRLHISHLRWRLHHLGYIMDKTSGEMAQAWIDEPGSDHWRALDTWLAELFIERRQLRERIETLAYRLGRDTY